MVIDEAKNRLQLGPILDVNMGVPELMNRWPCAKQ